MSQRQTAIELLKKIDAPHTEKISLERAMAKLKRYLTAETMPQILTAAETELLIECGFKFEKKSETKPVTKKPTQPKTQYLSWVEAATKAILNNTSLKKAAVDCITIFKEANPTSNIKGVYGTLYVSYAYKVLVMVGQISINGDVIEHL
jgi:hypothetical protein